MFSNYFEEIGSGSPLILLHGNGEDSSYFEHQISFFSKMYRVIAIDTRGHGKSARGQPPFTLSQFTEDLHNFMLQHQIQRAHILGFSDGANIAMLFALKYPDMIDKLILNGGNLYPSGVKRRVQIPVEIGYKITKFFSRKSENALRNHELLALMVEEPNISADELKKIKSPVLVIAGTKDMIKKDHTELIYNSLNNAKLVFIKGDHFIANKAPEAFNAAVYNFLNT